MLIFSNFLATIILIVTLLMLATAIVNLFFRVPYVPTKKRVVKRMIEIAKLKKGQIVYDLGCGDGRLLLEAEKMAPIQARGYEIAPIPYLLAIWRKWRNHSKIRIHMKNFFTTKIADADVIFCYLGPDIMIKLYAKAKKECKKGTQIISNTFSIKGVTPKKIWEKDPIKKLPKIYVYEI